MNLYYGALRMILLLEAIFTHDANVTYRRITIRVPALSYTLYKTIENQSKIQI